MHAGHGPNIGNGFVKYVIIDRHGNELEPVVFPAMIAPAARAVAGAIHTLDSVSVAGRRWWTGDDALYAPSPITRLAQDRLTDPAFVPALLAGALQRLGHLNGSSAGPCVTGLPATWARDPEKCKALGERLRAAYPGYQAIKVIPEPLGLVYAALLDNHGQIAGSDDLQRGRVAVVDLGHLTVDVATIRKMVPEPSGTDTFQLGTSRPLSQIRSALSQQFERELTIAETDLAVRAGTLRVAGREQPLPAGWDRPLSENAEAVVARLVESWGSGKQFDAILIGGGGAEVPHLTRAMLATFDHAVVIDRPQTAIARGYARLARRLGATQ